MSAEDLPPPLLFDYAPVAGGGKPVVPLRLMAGRWKSLVVATIAPGLPRTILSPVQAAAIDLSAGATVVAQILHAFDVNSPPWGPQEIIVPVIAEELDEPGWRGLSGGLDEEDDEADAGWRQRDACLLGHDFLRNITVFLIGQRGRLALLDINDM